VADLPINSNESDRKAALALVAATLFWGFGFTWAKIGGESVNAAMNLPNGAYVGPIFLLAWRFAIASVLWAILFRDARTGWTLASVRRGIILGVFMYLRFRRGAWQRIRLEAEPISQPAIESATVAAS